MVTALTKPINVPAVVVNLLPSNALVNAVPVPVTVVLLVAADIVPVCVKPDGAVNETVLPVAHVNVMLGCSGLAKFKEPLAPTLTEPVIALPPSLSIPLVIVKALFKVMAVPSVKASLDVLFKVKVDKVAVAALV